MKCGQQVGHKVTPFLCERVRKRRANETPPPNTISDNCTTIKYHHHQLLRIMHCGLFQFRITPEVMNQFKHLTGLLGRLISSSQDLCLHRAAQHRKTRTHMHSLSGIRTRDPSTQAANAHAPDHAATEIGVIKLSSSSAFTD
jgi:hypothetical protein